MSKLKVVDINFHELPLDMIEEICEHLTAKDLSSLRITNKTFAETCLAILQKKNTMIVMETIPSNQILGCKKKNKLLEILCQHFDEIYRSLHSGNLIIDISFPPPSQIRKFIDVRAAKILLTEQLPKRVYDFTFDIKSTASNQLVIKKYLSLSDVQKELLNQINKINISDNPIINISRRYDGSGIILLGILKIVNGQWI